MTGLRARKSATAGILLTVAVAMIGLSFAAVPLYRLFCQVTGYGGTPQVAEQAPGAASERVMTVRFNADVGPDLAWSFRPAQREVKARVGEEALAFFDALNDSNEAVTGTAVFNVTPLKAGPYFSKIDCFCFTEQVLAPGERAKLAVSFFIDPEILDDPNMHDLETITLSYTFFRVAGAGAGGSGGMSARALDLATPTEH